MHQRVHWININLFRGIVNINLFRGKININLSRGNLFRGNANG
jgi:hypothetical protein